MTHNPITNTTLPNDAIHNIQALAAYISHNLHTVLYQIDLSGNILASYCDIPDFSDTFISSVSISDYVNQCVRDKIPLFFSYNDICYALVCPSSQDFGFLLGPFQISSPVRLCHANSGSQYDVSVFSDRISVVTIENISEIVLLLHNLYSDNVLTGNDISLHNLAHQDMHLALHKRYTNLVFENQENTIHHNPYDQEVREFASIRNGDLEMLKKTMEEDYTGTIGTLASTPLRDCQNLAIVLITLASRAAMEGGVLPEIAYTLSDTYIQKVEELRVPAAAVQLAKQAEFHYAALVRDTKVSKSSDAQKHAQDFRINQCKGYIFSHLHGKISTADIAQAMHMNPNYLSNLFKKEEGITITEYILNEKIKLVQNMLVYSHYSYSAIATYLGFSSQSHLGKQFKQITGLTLQQYRRKYGKKDFDFWV